ncbi:MAG: DNA primase [Rickettsiales bacterium]|nr:DNA primase [Rickettsiales bacterium]
MTFSSSAVSKIHDIVRISDVISKKVKLQKKGKDFFGLCPFHHEKSPSFSVNDEKNFYHCFGCGAHGDSIKFVQDTQNLNFVDAVKSLTSAYNIKVAEPTTNPVEKSKRIRILEINSITNSWFHDNLFSRNASHIVKYLNTRDMLIDCINNFAIGYAPFDGALLIKHLLSLGYSSQEITESGIAIDKNGRQLCKFRNRVIFPIKNYNGEVIAFGGRVISDNDVPKYLNSPETLVFKKKTALYLENIAFKNVKNTDTIFVVEGYIDAISMHSVGLINTVATLGTAISDFHVMKLWKKVKVPTICMDGDRAGLAAIEKVIRVVLPLLKPGYSLKFVKLPMGYDPDDLIKTHGSMYFKDLVVKTTNLCEIVWDIYVDKINTEIPENKALLKTTLFEVSSTISNLEIKRFYEKYFLEKINDLFSKNYFIKQKTGIQHIDSSSGSLIKNLSFVQRYEHTLVAILLNNPNLLRDSVLFEKFESIIPKTKDLDRVYKAVIDCFAKIKSEMDTEIFVEYFQKDIKKHITEAFFNYLCGKSSCFIDTISKKNIDENSKLWFDTFRNYNLELIKDEYELLVKKLDQASFDKANELKKEIELLDKNKNSYNEQV